MGLTGVCLSLVTAAGLSAGNPVFVPLEHFTLAWIHSIEKVRWEEDYAVLPAQTPGSKPILKAASARIKGSAAGMEPPADAKLKNGWYEYQPTIREPTELRLSRSFFTADYEWCMRGSCQSMSALMASDGGLTLVRACSQSQALLENSIGGTQTQTPERKASANPLTKIHSTAKAVPKP
jgi:hypothetical protein